MTIERELALEKAQQGTLETKLLMAQLAALAQKPAVGLEEPWIARRRVDLGTALAKAELPMMIARDTLAKNGVLVVEIDQIIQDRARDQLVARRSSVLEPDFWQAVDAQTRLGSVRPAATTAPGQAPARAITPGQIALTMGLGGLAIAIAIFAHRWVFAIGGRTRQSAKTNLGFAFLKDMADIVLPMLVLLCVLTLLGWFRGDPGLLTKLGNEIIIAGVIAIYFHWLGHCVFMPFFAAGRLVDAPKDTAERAVWLITAIGVLLAGENLVEYFDTRNVEPSGVSTLISLAIIFGISGCLWALAGILKAVCKTEAPAQQPRPHDKGGKDILKLIGWSFTAVAIATPLPPCQNLRTPPPAPVPPLPVFTAEETRREPWGCPEAPFASQWEGRQCLTRK